MYGNKSLGCLWRCRKKKKLPISQRRAPEYQNKLSMRYFIIVAKVSNKIEYPKKFPVIFY